MNTIRERTMRLSLLALLAMVSYGAAAEWVKMGSSNSMDYYIDPTTIRRAGNMVKMWRIFDFNSKQITSGIPYFSTKSQEEYDCAGEQSRILFVSAYSENMGNGVSVLTSNTPVATWEPVSPGSVVEQLWKVAGGKK